METGIGIGDATVEISGVVESVIYHNENNGYAVFRLADEDEDRTVIVVGAMPFIGAGEYVIVSGVWTRHSSYGEQLKAVSAERIMPTDESAILTYLSSGNISGIGPVTAKRIVDNFGEESLEVIERSPRRLAQIQGITEKKAEEISASFRRQRSIRKLMQDLLEYDIQPHVVLLLYKWYGELSGELVSENPYILTNENFGVEFDNADRMAADLGFESDSEKRVDAGVLFELEYNLRGGHVFIPVEKLADAAAGLLKVERTLCIEAIDRLCLREAVVSERVANVTACYLKRLHETENSAAAELIRLAQAEPPAVGRMDKIFEEVSSELGLEFDTRQMEAIRTAAVSRVMLLTGGPGTGKSTSVRGMTAVFDKLGFKTVLCSPTGRAAKRLSELCGREATTIHRLLEVDFTDSPTFMFKRGREDPINADVVILDETSMVDISLLNSLLLALRGDARLIMVGDPDQLPSVGPGNVLRDLLRSGRINTVRLTEIFRQAENSNIVLNAHRINRGEFPQLKYTQGDFYFVARNSAASTAETIVDLCKTRLPKSMGVDPSQIQVLTPTRRGEAGTASLNAMLQKALNPEAEGKAERRFGDYTFRTGDRVMHIRNNYDLAWRAAEGAGSGLGVFNGDIGVVLEIDNRSETAIVRYDDRLVDYPFDLLNELEPAYAMTVHKSQGSEYKAVVLAAADAPRQLLSRSVLYTAVTRAQELLVIVGSDSVLQRMVENNEKHNRYSGLKVRMTAKKE